MSNIRVSCSIYFGSVLLKSINGKPGAIRLEDVTSNKAGASVYRATLPYERFIFDDLDLSQFDVEQEMGAYPYAVLRVDYERVGASTPRDEGVTLGWAKFRAYSQNADSRRQSNFTVGSRVTLTRGGGGSGPVDLDKWHLVTREFEEPILPGPSSSRIDLNAAVADANTYKDMGEVHANSVLAVLKETFG